MVFEIWTYYGHAGQQDSVFVCSFHEISTFLIPKFFPTPRSAPTTETNEGPVGFLLIIELKIFSMKRVDISSQVPYRENYERPVSWRE